jgi:mono/diheme cytochrome c family protein
MQNYKCRALSLFGAATISFLIGCKASPPSPVEKKVVQESKDLVIGGKDRRNPIPNDASTLKLGAEHFQHHCQICHGLDGHTTGVTFARNMSPPVPDLGSADIQKYTDGQLKWIMENGIRMTGMPGWKGLLEDNEMWQMALYIRHLPTKGSLGIPEVFARESEDHAQDQNEYNQKVN